MHVKCALIGRYQIIGSTNWTVAARCNHERSEIVKLSRSGYDEKRKGLQKIWSTGYRVPLNDPFVLTSLDIRPIWDLSPRSHIRKWYRKDVLSPDATY